MSHEAINLMTPEAPTGLEIHLVENRMDDATRRQQMNNLRFGSIFAEHMATMSWSVSEGWTTAKIIPFGPITMSPATSVLHYGQSVFEGFKAYRWADGSVHTFRSRSNADRLCRSARRLAMPEIPVDAFLETVDELIRIDHMWVPSEEEQSLYIRPVMFASQLGLGVKPSSHYKLLIITSPVGAYFASGVKPVAVWLAREYIRAAPGGTGTAKFAGNYAASLLGQAKAMEMDCDQVVWLDAHERRFVEEMGGMNIFFVFKENGHPVLVTPDLETGTLLPGITRDSLLTLARDKGYQTRERRISIEEWERGLNEGRITEVFACGTAAVVTPIGTVKSSSGTWTINQGEIGPIAAEMRRSLLDIQYGRAEDRYGWMHRVM